MATVEELKEYLVEQEARVVRAKHEAMIALNNPKDREERVRLIHLADRYGHFLEVIFCIKRFLEGEEVQLCRG